MSAPPAYGQATAYPSGYPAAPPGQQMGGYAGAYPQQGPPAAGKNNAFLK